MSGLTGRLDVTRGTPDPAVVRCEAEVLGLRYGDTVESLHAAYGGYADRTVWLSVLDETDQVLGCGRLIVPGAKPTKTLVDITQDPWHLDPEDVAAQAGLDPDACLDIATIAVKPDLGARGALVAAALYHGMVMTTRVNELPWAVAVMHLLARRVLGSNGLVMHALPGATPGMYQGGPGFLPVYANMDRLLADQRRSHPEAHRRVAVGDIESVHVPQPQAYLLPRQRIVDLRDGADVRGT